MLIIQQIKYFDFITQQTKSFIKFVAKQNIIKPITNEDNIWSTNCKTNFFSAFEFESNIRGGRAMIRSTMARRGQPKSIQKNEVKLKKKEFCTNCYSPCFNKSFLLKL